MLPAVWSYIAVVAFGWALLFYVELRSRAKRHIKRGPLLTYVSSAGLASLIVTEPDLTIVELASRPVSACRSHIPDAVRVPIDRLQDFCRQSSSNLVLVFYDSAADPVNWRRVEDIVEACAKHHVFVLRGGLEGWLDRQNTSGMAVAS